MVTTLLDAIGASFRVTDAVDVLLVAIFVYSVILALKKARSRFVFLGLALLVALYAAAQQLALRVTLLLFHGAITVAVVALVVIFQEDIRRAFERLAATPGRRLPRQNLPFEQTVDVVVQSAGELARRSLGALIVIKGHEPLERHITGGVILEGKLSDQLLLSIFHPSTPGHDGAVVVEEGRALLFGGHLPLTTSDRLDAHFGTRHAAALGLAECSDALVVVVSEERGAISLAHDGELKPISVRELSRALKTHFERLSPEVKLRWWSGALSRNMGAKVISLFVALGAWLLLVGHQSQVVERTVTVPVVVADVPERWLLEEPRPAQVRVTLSGTNGSFDRFQAAEAAVQPAVTELRQGTQRVALRETDMVLPAGISVVGLEPRFITLVAFETVTRNIPVRPKLVGKLRRGLYVRSVAALPQRVPLVFRRAELGQVRSVNTAPIDVTDMEATTTVAVDLVIPRGVHNAEDTPSTVTVRVELTTTRPPRPPRPPPALPEGEPPLAETPVPGSEEQLLSPPETEVVPPNAMPSEEAPPDVAPPLVQ
jgi:uncharacterized protein (TIGR00159 family)